MYFNNWDSMVRIMVVAPLAYLALLVCIRISGKRTLSKMNAFDFVITIAIGSAFATIVLSRQTALADGVLALGLLIFLQYSVSWLSVRSAWVSSILKGEPSLLFWNGRFIQSKMRKERVTSSEVLQAIRSQGLESLSQCEAVVLESDGSFSVIRSQGSPPSSLQNVPTDGLPFSA